MAISTLQDLEVCTMNSALHTEKTHVAVVALATSVNTSGHRL